MHGDGFFSTFPAADVDNSVSRAVYWGYRATNRGGLTACGSSARGRRLASVLWEKEGKTVIFGKYINRYYLRHAPTLLLGILSLLMVDYIQLLVPQLYRLVINGVNLGQVVVKGETMPFTREVLFQHICLPMIWIVLFMVVGRFLWRICFFGTSIRVQADLRERMFDHSRRLSQQYYQVNKVGNLMSLYTNDLDTIQECFGDGILMFFDALVLGLLALYKMWRMDTRLTLLALIPAAFMFAIGTVMGKNMTRTWEKRQQAFSALSDFAQENFSGIAVIKAFVKELKELIAFRKLNKENEEVNVEYTRISVLLEVLVTFFVESVVCVILGYGGFLVYKGDFNAGQLVEYIGYFEAIVWPIMAISMLIEKTSRGKASLNRITELLDAPIDVADRAGVPIVSAGEGADPAAVIFDTVKSATARGYDMVIADTAGRLHNKANLMAELSKISRSVKKASPEASLETLLVLDAITGQNAISQAKEFCKAADATGIILTKLDGTAKGGCVVAVKQRLGLPVRFIGVGEGIDDLLPFTPEGFVEELLPRQWKH